MTELCFGSVSIYWLKQLEFAGTAGKRPVFFLVQNRGCTCISALIGTVYTSRTGRYGTVLTSLVKMALKLSLAFLSPNTPRRRIRVENKPSYSMVLLDCLLPWVGVALIISNLQISGCCFSLLEFSYGPNSY